MIKNERQYRMFRARAEKLARTLTAGGESGRSRVGSRHKLEAELVAIRREIARYDDLRSGRRKPPSVRVSFVEDLPNRLIQARIAAGMTQKEFAGLLGLKEQQVQHYEATGYASASLARVIEIAKTLVAAK